MPPARGRECSTPGERVEQLLAGAGGEGALLHAQLDALRVAQGAQAERAGRRDGELELLVVAVVAGMRRQADHEVRAARLLVLAHHDGAGAGRGLPVHVAQVVARLVLAQRVERDVVAREVGGRQALEVAQEAERLALERARCAGARRGRPARRGGARARTGRAGRRGRRSPGRPSRRRAWCVGMAKSSSADAPGARRCTSNSPRPAPTGSTTREGRMARLLGVRQRQRADGALAHDHARAREVERHVVGRAADEEQRAQREQRRRARPRRR